MPAWIRDFPPVFLSSVTDLHARIGRVLNVPADRESRAVIRLRPEHPPPTSTAASSVASPHTSPVGYSIPLNPSPPASPSRGSTLADTTASSEDAIGADPAAVSTSSASLQPSVLEQLDDFFAQPWVNNPSTTIEILYIKRATRTTEYAEI